jgi:hypothetical protein
MTFGRFHCIAGNFLIIRCWILNFKNFDFILLVKKYSVCRFVPSSVRVLDKFLDADRFFSPYGKNLSPCGKSFNQSIYNLSLASSRTGRIADFCLCFASMPLNLPLGERFLPYGEKNLSLWGNLSRTRTGLGAKRRTLYFLNFYIKNENFKILNPSPDGEKVTR